MCRPSYYAAVRLQLPNPTLMTFNPYPRPDLSPFELNKNTHRLLVPGNVYSNFVFLRFFLFSSWESVPYRRTDGRTDR